VARLIRGREVLRALQRAGFTRVSQRGSHIKLKKRTAQGELVVIVPNYREVAEGTLDSILQMAQMTREEFEGLL